ncbi:MAG: hypothetical protein M1819_003078 [Sarea resinae]|nr:MAG: hypothetical protein M1819_003078 [Sarea resinae]
MSKPAFDSFSFLPQGAIIQKFLVDGTNIVQGFPTPDLYKTHNGPFFGETIGRIANRVANAKITNLNGKQYTLAANNGPNSLHGGSEGWGKKVFDGPKRVERNGKQAVLFTYVSKDGEEGYPGTVEVRVWYTPEIDAQGKTTLEIEYEAELVNAKAEGVEETAVALTNHSYFNLSSGPTIAGTQATLHTSSHLPFDSTSVPLGSIGPYPSLPASPFTLGPKEPDFDDCFVLNPNPSTIPLDSRSLPLKPAASFSHPDTKLHLDVLTTEPAFQFYTGGFVDVPAVAGVDARGPRAGLCVEACRYVNAVNVPEWRHTVVVKPGEKFGARTVWRAWKE